jgi:hypothetical protein
MQDGWRVIVVTNVAKVPGLPGLASYILQYGQFGLNPDIGRHPALHFQIQAYSPAFQIIRPHSYGFAAGASGNFYF